FDDRVPPPEHRKRRERVEPPPGTDRALPAVRHGARDGPIDGPPAVVELEAQLGDAGRRRPPVDEAPRVRRSPATVRRDLAYERFIVERPEVLRRAAAPYEEDDVEIADLRETVELRDHRLDRAVPLDLSRGEDQLDARIAARRHRLHVAPGGAARARDHAD